MAMIDRYKKKGGFVALLNLLETTGKEKKEKFLKVIQEETPAWHAELTKKMISMDRVCNWSIENLMEILPRLPYQQVGSAIFSLPEDKKSKFLSALGGSEKRKVEEAWKETQPNAAEISTCQVKLLTEIRKMASEGQLKFETVDPEMVIPEGIEEALNNGSASTAVGAAPGGTASASLSSEALAKAAVTVAPAPAGLPAAVAEELTLLRKKVVVLGQENQKLVGQITMLQGKLEQIKKIA